MINKDIQDIFHWDSFIELNTDFLKEDITDDEKKKKEKQLKLFNTLVQG